MSSTTTTKRSVSRKHDWVDERRRALDAAIADKVRCNPALLDTAKANVFRWIDSADIRTAPLLHEWKGILEEWPIKKILDFLVQDSERANRLRQSSPFCGILTEEERLKIFEHYETL